MNNKKVLSLIAAIFGLVVTVGLFYGALKFYHTIKEIAKANPSLVAPRDTLRLNPDADALLDTIASLNQQIAENLYVEAHTERKQKQILLNTTITDLVFILDSLKESGAEGKSMLLTLKHAVNKANLEFRAALFSIEDAAKIPELEKFMLVDENKLENTIFECFLKKEKQCFDLIKHQALYVEWIILEKNFSQLKT